MYDITTKQFDRQVQELDRISEKPSLQALAYALRNPDVWPEGFTWDYQRTQHCAIGLAARLWPRHFSVPSITETLVVFGISIVAAYAIFIDARVCYRTWFLRGFRTSSTTPADVADMIDTYLQKGDIPVMWELMGLR